MSSFVFTTLTACVPYEILMSLTNLLDLTTSVVPLIRELCSELTHPESVRFFTSLFCKVTVSCKSFYKVIETLF